jgi:hypothetical protein
MKTFCVFTTKALLRRAVAIVLHLILCGAVSTQLLLAQPKLQLSNLSDNTFDWGTVMDVSKPLQAKIELKNAGDKELLISEVRPGCGCTAAMPEKTKLAPGETTVMNVSLNIGTNNGQMMKTVAITSNSEPDMQTVLTLKANIVRPIQAEPAFVAFPTLFVGREATASTKLKNNTAKTITLTDIKANGGVTTTLKAPYKIPPGATVELPLKVVPQVQGYLNADIVIATDHPDQKTFEVRMYGNINVLTPSASPAMNPNSGGN